MDASLTIVIHGESGAGKSWLADTAPAPRLVLDAEGGTGWTQSKKVYWDPLSGSPPPATEDTCVATIKNFQAMGKVLQWLQSGKHPFKSVVIDSLTEIQKRCLDNVSGTEAMTQQGWGEVLRKMEALVRSFRDLTIPNGTPGLPCVVFVAGSQVKDGVTRPHLQGQLGNTLPYFVDVVGYLYLKQNEDGDIVRSLLTAPVGGFAAKDRTGQFGTVVNDPNVATMLATLEEARRG